MKLVDKIIITGDLTVRTGLHIGTSKDFSPIGAVDSPVVRNPLNYQPIIPGSTLKGKLRSLLASIVNRENSKVPYLKIQEEPLRMKRLFGSSAGEKEVIQGRLQFYDLKLKENSAAELERADLDLPYTEIKFENVINRGTGVAMPRQIERVVAGSVFEFKLVYNVENIQEMKEDFDLLKKGLCLLEEDYIGGSGTRGYGRIKIHELKTKSLLGAIEDVEKLNGILNEEY